MTRTDRTLCTAYGAIAAIALFGTWTENLAFMSDVGTSSGVVFIKACFANHAAASISIDILAFGLAAFIFMGVEAKRLGIRFFWLYVVLSLFVAISVMFPIFMIVRQRKIAARATG